MDRFTPPNGINFRMEEDQPVSVLCDCLCRVTSFLGKTVSDTELIQYHDWWEHDGLHFERGAIKFIDLLEMVKTAQAAYSATPEDEYVCVGISPRDRQWYLRFRAYSDDVPDSINGYFDVTLPDTLASEFRHEVLPHFRCPIIEELAAEYYRRIIL